MLILQGLSDVLKYLLNKNTKIVLTSIRKVGNISFKYFEAQKCEEKGNCGYARNL